MDICLQEEYFQQNLSGVTDRILTYEDFAGDHVSQVIQLIGEDMGVDCPQECTCSTFQKQANGSQGGKVKELVQYYLGQSQVPG